MLNCFVIGNVDFPSLDPHDAWQVLTSNYTDILNELHQFVKNDISDVSGSLNRYCQYKT